MCKNMLLNQFIESPSDDILVDVEHLYSINDGIIHVGIEDYHAVISGADNVIIIEGKGSGRCRVSNALEDAVLKSCMIAPEFNLFTAEKVVVKLIYRKDKELMMEEMSALLDLSEMFSNKPYFVWGISSSENIDPNFDTIALIVASNIKQK